MPPLLQTPFEFPNDHLWIATLKSQRIPCSLIRSRNDASAAVDMVVCNERKLAAPNGGATNGGLRGVWPPFPEINRFVAFFALFVPFFALFWRVRGAPGKSIKRRKKAFFLRYPWICLNSPLLNPHLRHPKQSASTACEISVHLASHGSHPYWPICHFCTPCHKPSSSRAS